MTTYAEVAARLLRLENRELGQGSSDEQIAAAERMLGIPIEGGYRQFLKQFGWGGVEHIELYGLGSGLPAHLDLVQITRSEREEMEPRLQRHLLPMMNDGGGNLLCLDTNKETEPTVVFWDHGRGAHQKPAVEAEDFASWLDHLLNGLR